MTHDDARHHSSSRDSSSSPDPAAPFSSSSSSPADAASPFPLFLDFLPFFFFFFSSASSLSFFNLACSGFSGSGHTFMRWAHTAVSRLPGVIWIRPRMVKVCFGTSVRHTCPMWGGCHPSMSSHISFMYASASLKVRVSLMLSCLLTSDITILHPSQCCSLVMPGMGAPMALAANSGKISGIVALTSSGRSFGSNSWPGCPFTTSLPSTTTVQIRKRNLVPSAAIESSSHGRRCHKDPSSVNVRYSGDKLTNQLL
mmetsp:Transcript_29547/g.64509  ORF Transcript_29547/g.64509 Transcript_29547/m.64509 type:complete len:255 (-) Transcript_29547:31-795(-)